MHSSPESSDKINVYQKTNDRMSVIVRREDREEWFLPGELGELGFWRITTPYKAEEMSALAVSRLGSSVAAIIWILKPAVCFGMEFPIPPTWIVK
jgi:hypothetical protein